MEVPQQLPPQKQSIVTTQSVDKTLLTTKEVLRLPMEIQRLPVRMDRLEKDLALCNKKRIKLEKRFDILIDEIDDNTQLINKRFKKLEYKNIKESLGILDLENFNKSSDSESSDDDEKSEDSTEDKPLSFKEQLEQLQAKIEKFEFFFKTSLEAEESAKALQSTTIMNVQLEVIDLKDDIEALKEQIKSLTTVPETVKTELAAFQEKYTEVQKNIKVEFATFQKKHTEEQEKLLQSSGTKNAYLENLIQQQSQEISTLRRWLMAMGGGSACALALFIWHYTHSK